MRLLSGEWTTHILWVLSINGPTRHGALKRLIDGISSKVLTDRLRMPEAEGGVCTAKVVRASTSPANFCCRFASDGSVPESNVRFASSRFCRASAIEMSG